MAHDTFGAFGFSKASIDKVEETDKEAERQQLLWQLATVLQDITQQEEVITQASAAKDQLETRVANLRHAVEHAEGELRQRGQQTPEEKQRLREEQQEARMRADLSNSPRDDQEEEIPEAMLKELKDLHVDLATLQDRHEYLQNALLQATEALEHADDEREQPRPQGRSGSRLSGPRNEAAKVEIAELEREVDRLQRREAKLADEQYHKVLELQEEILYLEAQSRDERWAITEEIQILIAEGEVLEAEIEGVKAGAQRALSRLEKEEELLKEEVARAQAEQAARQQAHSSEMVALKIKAEKLREATEETQRISDPAMKPNRKPTKLGVFEADASRSPRPSGNATGERVSRGRKKTMFDEIYEAQSPEGSARQSESRHGSGGSGKKSPRPRGTLVLTSMQQVEAPLTSDSSRPSSSFQTQDATWTWPSTPSQLSARRSSLEEEGHQEMLSVTLDRSNGESLGIGVNPELMITAIQEQGLMASWNGTHSLSTVCAGYKIVEVNGTTELKKMIKLLKSFAILELKLQWKGLPKESPRPSLNRSRNLRRQRSSLANFNATGVVRTNRDDNEDAVSATSSADSGVVNGADAVLMNVSGMPFAGGGKLPKLSIIGEDSTITGDASSIGSFNAGDTNMMAADDVQTFDRSTPETPGKSFSLVDADDGAELDMTKQNSGSLEVSYDALEKVLDNGSQKVAGRTFSLVDAEDTAALETTGQNSHSLEVSYDGLERVGHDR